MMTALSRMLTSVLISIAAVASLACTPDFAEVWDVQDLRLLGIRAEPPEVLVSFESVAAALIPTGTPAAAAAFPTVRIEALVVDPRDPEQTLRWQAIACTPEESRCKDAKLSKIVFPPPDSQEQWATAALDEIWFDFTLDSELATAALAADPFREFGGLPIMIELRLQGEEEVIGIKRVVYGVTGSTETLRNLGLPKQMEELIAALLAPEGKKRNNNPVLAQVKVDDEVVTPPLMVVPNKEIVLLPESPSKERYIVKTFSRLDSISSVEDLESLEFETKELDEYLSYAFYVTDGVLSHAVTGGRPSLFVTNKKVDDVTSSWTPPMAEEQVESGTIWVVVRDDRGGIDWLTIPFEM